MTKGTNKGVNLKVRNADDTADFAASEIGYLYLVNDHTAC